MEIRSAKYDEATRADIAEVMKLWQTATPGAAPALRRLMKRARALDDAALLGFAYYHFADLYYYREPDYALFKKNIGLAIKALMQSGEKDLLARAYNFVAIDAANHGSYDVAYNYFMTCARLCEDEKDSLVTGIAYSNIGQLFNEIGSYDLARRYVRNGIRLLRKHPEDGKYYRNLINMNFQDGMISLALNRFTDVEKTLKTIEGLMNQFNNAEEGALPMPLAFLRVRVALGRGDTEEAYRLFDDLIDALVHEPQLYDCIDDVFTFLKYLIDENHLPLARRIIKTIEDKVEDCGITHIMVLFSEIMVSYYSAAGSERMVTKQLRKQYELTKALHADQQQIQRFSIDLIRMVTSLQDEQARIIKENEALQQQAQTDALTGLANRHAMNAMLSGAFERAYRGRRTLGIEILDIDFFKEYNDTYGHHQGDECLSLIAKELLKLTFLGDVFCARYGGDEFIVIYENMTEKEILAAARQLEASIADRKIPHKKNEGCGYVTVSQGICTAVPKNKNKLWDFLEKADSALYSIKNARTVSRAGESERIRITHIPGSFT